MGRTKGKHLHVAAKALLKKFPEHFSGSFDENKKKLDGLEILVDSKSERNKLAGEISRTLTKNKPKEEPKPAPATPRPA